MVRRGPNEGTIRERADGRWEARVLVTEPDGRRVRRSLLGPTRTQVREKLRDALRAEAAGKSVPSDRLTVGAFLHQWLADTVRPSTRPSTFSSYASVVNTSGRTRHGAGQTPGESPGRRLKWSGADTFQLTYAIMPAAAGLLVEVA